MNDVDRSKLQNLYPTPKTYDEIRASITTRQEQRRPRHGSNAIACRVTLAIIITLIAGSVFSSLIGGTIVGAGAAITNVSTAFVVGLAGMALVWLIQKDVTRLAYEAFYHSERIRFIAASVYAVSVAIVVAFPFMVTVALVSGGSFMVVAMVLHRLRQRETPIV